MSRMTSRTRRRWHQAAATEPFFVHELGNAVLDAPTAALRSAVGCRTSRDFERQLAAAETEGWLERSPEVCINLERLDARMARDQQLSDRAHRGAETDVALLAQHGVEVQASASDWVLVSADGQVVGLAELAQILGVGSLGTAQWRLDRIRRLLNNTQAPTQQGRAMSAPLPHPPPHTEASPAAADSAGLAGRIVTLLETETDTEVRRNLSQALNTALGSRTIIATDSRSAPVRDVDATVRDDSVRERSEVVPEQELPVPLREQTTQDTREAQSRTARGLSPSDQWSSPAELEPIVRPLEQRLTVLGPNARRALMEWDPDQVRHAVDVLVGWIDDNGFKVRHASAYVTNAARSGYTSLFPLSSPTNDAEAATEQATEMWAQRAQSLPAATVVDMIDNAHGPAPGRTYDRAAHLTALTAAVKANPEVATAYACDRPDTPNPDEFTTVPTRPTTEVA